jgi:AcrR family transcriptional regulator
MPEPARQAARRPGRPKEGEDDLRDGILNQAELAFASDGFEGARLRDIAARARVNQALVRYYFGSKQNLFDELFRRRGRALAQERSRLLRGLQGGAHRPSVAEIIRAYLSPQWQMKQAGGNAAAFLRLQARVHASPEAHDLRLRREIYDAPLALYVDELHRALPDLPRGLIALRMGFLVGSYLFVLNDLARLDDLVGDSRPAAEDSVLDELVRFLAAGISAPVPELSA